MSKKENKIKSMGDILKIVKIQPLLEDYTEINPNGGIRMRINNKGSNERARKELKPEEKEGLENGLIEFFNDGLDFLKPKKTK